jgi:hypothetical protein
LLPSEPHVDLSAARTKIVGEAAGDFAGVSVTNLGDISGDGVDDFGVGAFRESTVGTSAGAAYLLEGPIPSGTVDLSSADAKHTGEAAGDNAGCRVAAAGDTDGDGTIDVAIGANQDEGTGTKNGRAYLLLDPLRASSASLADADAEISGAYTSGFLGSGIAGPGDVDGDGFADLLVSEYGADAPVTNAGAAYLFLGPLAGAIAASSADATFQGRASGDYLQTVNAAGDLDGDGLGDLLMGAPDESTAGGGAGAVYLFYAASL